MPNINAMQSSTDYDLIVGKSSAANNSTSSENFKETFSAILNREKAAIRETLEEMKERKELLDRVKSERETNETIKRIMPDIDIHCYYVVRFPHISFVQLFRTLHIVTLEKYFYFLCY